MMRLKGRRRGFTLIEVALAAVIMTVGLLFCSTFFTNVYEQLSPRGDNGGLRRYIIAEEMIKAQAEAMRASKTIHPIYIKMITEPQGSKYNLDVDMITDNSDAKSQYLFYDLRMTHSGNPVATISVSTLRRKDSKNAKFGL